MNDDQGPRWKQAGAGVGVVIQSSTRMDDDDDDDDIVLTLIACLSFGCWVLLLCRASGGSGGSNSAT